MIKFFSLNFGNRFSGFGAILGKSVLIYKTDMEKSLEISESN